MSLRRVLLTLYLIRFIYTGMPQRIPSPRELQYHTQSIMQNALIRKKLEEQRENFRKRQEQEKQESAKKNQQDSVPTIAASSSSGDLSDQSNIQVTTTAPSQAAQEDSMKNSQMESPIKKSIVPAIAQHQIQRQHAPSPNIFTPTSVLRKMTAEKENDAGKISGRIDESKKKPITGGSQQQNAQHNSIRNQPPPQQSFMNNIGGMSQMDARMKMQNDGGVFGMSAWDSPQQQQQMQGMKPPGKSGE
jgi:hypothetical protein